jgi:hypothetical protein
MPDNKIELVVVVNGQPTPIQGNVNAPLHSLVGQALAATNNQGQPPENWELRDAQGNPLDASRKIGDLGLVGGAQVFLNLKAGVGGC